MDLVGIVNSCRERNIPFVLFSLPKQEGYSFLAQLSPLKANDALDMTKEQFVFSSFNGDGVIALQPDLFLVDGEWRNGSEELLRSTQLPALITNSKAPYITEKEEYLQEVGAITEAIEAAKFRKVILSRIKAIASDKEIHLARTFEQLKNAYPNAFTYTAFLPGIGTWAGASPESLVTIGQEELTTVSLAGTQLYKSGDIATTEWGTKELEEQQMVTDFVEQVISRNKISTFDKVGPYTIQAANLLHLKTKFSIPKTQELALENFVSELHPTPAVCGIPQQEARTFITSLEKHQRELYTGFLGPVNLFPETNLFVNLRCMQVIDQSYYLYVGGGITKASEAEKEWEETEIKAQTLLSIIEKM